MALPDALTGSVSHSQYPLLPTQRLHSLIWPIIEQSYSQLVGNVVMHYFEKLICNAPDLRFSVFSSYPHAAVYLALAYASATDTEGARGLCDPQDVIGALREYESSTMSNGSSTASALYFLAWSRYSALIGNNAALTSALLIRFAAVVSDAGCFLCVLVCVLFPGTRRAVAEG